MNESKTPQSQLKWQKKYDSQKMATIGLKLPIEERQQIEDASEKNGLKLATFCRKCIKYCIDKNVNIKDFTS